MSIMELEEQRCIECGVCYSEVFFYSDGRGGKVSRCIGCMITKRHLEKRLRRLAQIEVLAELEASGEGLRDGETWSQRCNAKVEEIRRRQSP